jgi:hypothetical protein
MAQKTQFRPGDEAPNNGFYIEVSEARHRPPVRDPQTIHLEKGEHFPETANKDRQWTFKKNV